MVSCRKVARHRASGVGAGAGGALGPRRTVRALTVVVCASLAGEGLAYVFSFLWKPPILILWKPRTDLDLATMDPTRETVVSSLYKGFGGALDKDAYYDEEDQLLILSDM